MFTFSYRLNRQRSPGTIHAEWNGFVCSSGLAGGVPDLSRRDRGVVQANVPTGVRNAVLATNPLLYKGVGLTAASGTQVVLSTAAPNDVLTLNAPDGTASIFQRATGSTGPWRPGLVTSPLRQGQTAVTSDATTGSVGTYRRAVTGRWNGPASSDWCAVLDPATALSMRGCQVITMNIATTGTPTDADPGDFTGRVSSITETMWDPGQLAMRTVVVARYAYDSHGYLVQVWNPQLDLGAGALKSYYSYEEHGSTLRLTTGTPASALDGGSPFLVPVSLSYSDDEHLIGAERVQPDGGDPASTVVVYGQPLAGGQRPDMSLGKSEKWDQTLDKAPTNAVAVFYPDPNLTCF